MDKTLLTEAQNAPFTSFRYLDAEELVLNPVTDRVIQKQDILLVCRKKDTEIRLLWSARSREAFLQIIEELDQIMDDLFTPGTNKLYIEFLQPEFVPLLEKLGFSVASQFLDFWNEDIASNTPVIDALPATLVVRHPSGEEYGEISELTRVCTGQSRGFYGEDAEFIKSWSEEEHSCVLLAEKEGQIAGVCMLNLYGFDSSKGPVLWIRLLAVSPVYQNQGIGHSLVSHSLSWGKARGARRSFLAVDAQNNNAIHLYEKYGFHNNDQIGQINMALVKE